MSVAGLPVAFARERRRAEAIAKGLNGIDFVDVAADRETLTVYFFRAAPKETRHRHYAVSGGTYARNLKIVEVRHAGGDDPARSDCLKIRVDRKGDFSTYRFSVVDLAGFDPLFCSVAFTFGRSPDIVVDPGPNNRLSAPAPLAEPDLDYLAKDFDSFRQLILDRFALNVPSWTETHLPDIGITLVDLLAYVGDQLSYYQDVVATEAYLDTARLRISARRHARLVDYKITEGCSARAYVSIETSAETSASETPTNLSPPASSAPARSVSFATSDNSAIFEPVGDGPVTVVPARSRIEIYTWDDTIRTLAAGATAATLCDTPDWALANTLTTESLLLFEEVIGPATGSPLDADPTRRCVVRLTSVGTTSDPPDAGGKKRKKGDIDPVTGQTILEVAWSIEDRLPFSLTLTTHDAQGAPIPNVSVARGNIVLADHGQTLATGEVIGTAPTTGSFRPKLAQPNLTYRAAPPDRKSSAAAAVTQDPRAATAQIVDLTSTVINPVTGIGGKTTTWTSHYDLLKSGSQDNDYVVEMDDDRYANLRFGDGTLGARPEPGATFTATYRTGNGRAGNVGAETIVHMNVNPPVPGFPSAGVTVRNPLAATGGTDPEPIAQIKLLAPQAATSALQRAVTPADYASIAEQNPAVFQAAAVLRWSGTRQTVRVALDPLGTETVAEALLASVAATLETVRSIGQDIEIVAAGYVPLDLELSVNVLPGYLQGDVAAALRDVFSNRILADGTLGVFHPQNLGFGQAIDENTLIAAAQGVTGVQTAAVKRIARLLDESEGVVPASGTLQLGPLEVARLDNDPSAPENGIFRLIMIGGR